jgi:DNA-binding transcriptional MocR family regulator
MPEDNAGTAVIARLEAAAAAGRPGERLPSVRELMEEFRVGPVTVQRAVAALAARGVVEARPGRGTFVAPPRAVSPAPEPDVAWQTVALGPARFGAAALDELLRPPAAGTYALSSGYLPADLQPTAVLAAALSRAARRPGAWDRVPVEGLASLRSWFATAIGGGLTPHDVLVCTGGQAAIDACLRALAGPGGALCVDSPTYLGALVAARAAGVTPVPVPTDEHGVRPDLLAAALERSGARVAYTQPLFANPTAATLAAERRAEVLEVVRAAGAFLIEDEPVRDFALDGAVPPPPLVADDPHGHVVHLRSLTKATAPGLRIAAIAARGPALARLAAARITADYFVPGVLQEAAVEVLTAPSWPKHLKRVRAALRERRDRLCQEVEAHLGLPAPRPRGGMHLWLALPPGVDDLALAAQATAHGVAVTPGTPWFPGDAPGPHLRLTYAGDTPDRLAEGVRRLAALVQPG